MGVARGISDRKALATTGHGEDLRTIAPPTAAGSTGLCHHSIFSIGG
jgi:hypothetical protein